jgi:hypothetical protein
MPTHSDQLQPGLPEYLYALAKSDGADPTLSMQYGSSATRNGEPYGELGLIIRQDAAWGDQRGKPRDPQAGNIPGGPRDVLRTSGTHVMNSPSGTVNLAPSAVVGPASAPSSASTVQAPAPSGAGAQSPVTSSGTRYAYSISSSLLVKTKKQAKPARKPVSRGPSRMAAL